MDDVATLDWTTAPARFREAHARLRTQLEGAETEITRLRRLVRGTEAAHREITMLRALGPSVLDSDAGQAFAGSYLGELTVEAVRAAWTGFRGAVQRMAEDLREEVH